MVQSGTLRGRSSGGEQGVRGPPAGRRARIIGDGDRWALPIRDSTGWRRGTKGPHFGTLQRSLWTRETARKSSTQSPPAPGFLCVLYLKPIDLLRVAKLLDKDIPFCA